MTLERVCVLVPIKSFDSGKSRLRDALSPVETVRLAKDLALGVIAASMPRTCLVACDDDAVADFAQRAGARVLRVEADDLNGAVNEAYRSLDSEFDGVIIAHGDLAMPAGLGGLRIESGVVLYTDRHGTGTNVLTMPTGLEFTFAYGEGSAERHRIEALHRGLAVTVVTNSSWGLDIDVPEDLTEPRM